MMNVPTDVAKQVVDSLKGTPFIMALLIVNTMALVGFGYVLHEVSGSIERREGLLKSCIERIQR